MKYITKYKSPNYNSRRNSKIKLIIIHYTALKNNCDYAANNSLDSDSYNPPQTTNNGTNAPYLEIVSGSQSNNAFSYSTNNPNPNYTPTYTSNSTLYIEFNDGNQNSLNSLPDQQEGLYINNVYSNNGRYSHLTGSNTETRNFYNLEDGIDLVHSYLSKNFIYFEYKNNFAKAGLDFGNINVDYFNDNHPFFSNVESFEYNYLIFNTNLNWKSLKFNFNYSFYDTDYTYLNQYVELGLSFAPEVKNVRYKPFGILSVNSMVINSIYDLNLTSSNLFEFDLNDFTLDDKRVTSLNAQIGLLFDGFRISYEMMNPFNERYSNKIQYSDNILPQLGSFSKINIIWIFKD